MALAAGAFLPPAQLAVPGAVLMLVALAESWNLLGGFAGYASFGHVAFSGLGGYALAVVMARAHVGFWVALPAAAAVCACFALVVGIPLLRLRGPAFSIATLGMAAGVAELVTVLPGVTGGGAGLTIPAYSHGGGEAYLSERGFYLAYLVVATGSVAVVAAVSRSRLGLALRSIRADEEVAASLGVATTRVKVLTFALSAVVAGLAGAVAAFQQVVVFPDSSFDVSLSALTIAAVVLGGAGTVFGPALGAVVVGTLYQLLGSYDPVSQALLLAVVIVVAGASLPVRAAWDRSRARTGAAGWDVLRRTLDRYRV